MAEEIWEELSMSEVTCGDFMDGVFAAFLATAPKWYVRIFLDMQFSDEEAGIIAKSILLTLHGRSDEIDIGSLSEKGRAAYCCALTWMQDIKECLDMAGDDYE